MQPSMDPISERRLNAIIVAATLAVILVAVIAIAAFVESREPAAGDRGNDGFALTD